MELSTPVTQVADKVLILFIAGTADQELGIITPRDRAAEVVTGPYYEVMIDGAEHWLQRERPDDVNSTLLEFLAGVKWNEHVTAS